MFNLKPNHDKNMKLFWKNFTELVERYGALEEIKKFDLVFFPVVKQSHYYLLCFDLKNGSSHIIDNSATEVSDSAKYGNVPKTLQRIFLRFLNQIGDDRTGKFSKVVPKRETMKWRTKENHHDCAIFVMRHMETFMGAPTRAWDCGLEEESKA